MCENEIVLEEKLINSEKERKKLILMNKLIRDELLGAQRELKESKDQFVSGERKLKEVADKFIFILDQLDDVHNVISKSENKMLERNMESLINIIKKELELLGLYETTLEGDTFDAKVHECIQAVDDAEKEKYEIIDVVRRGYKLEDKIIRVAKVIVVR